MDYKFPYKEVLKKAWRLAWQYKWLWVLGLFIVGPGDYNFLGIISENLGIPEEALDYQDNAVAFQEFLTQNPLWAAIAFTVFLLIIFLFLYVNGLAGAGVISTAFLHQEKKEEPNNLKKIIKRGARFAWKMVAISVAQVSILIFSTALLVAPVYYLLSQGLESRAAWLSFVAFVIFVPLYIVVNFTVIYARNFVVLGEMNVRQSVLSGWDLFSKYWKISILQALLIVLIYSVAIIGFMLAVGMGGLFFRGLMFLANNLAEVSIKGFADVSGAILLSLVGLLFGAVVSVWQTAAWTYTWMELVRQQKIEEKQKAEVAVEPTVGI